MCKAAFGPCWKACYQPANAMQARNAAKRTDQEHEAAQGQQGDGGSTNHEGSLQLQQQSSRRRHDVSTGSGLLACHGQMAMLLWTSL